MCENMVTREDLRIISSVPLIIDPCRRAGCYVVHCVLSIPTTHSRCMCEKSVPAMYEHVWSVAFALL